MARREPPRRANEAGVQAAPEAAFPLGRVYWLLLLAAYAFFLFHRIDLTTADLGRHLKNGEWFWTHRRIPATNFYSYTFPDFPVVNHHWGGGVLFYLVWTLAGFPGLSWMFAALSLGTFALFYRVAEREGGSGPALLAALLVLPLLTERLEIRPEAFSYLFCGVFFSLLWKERREPAPRLLWLLPALEVAWVNCHIYFFLGPLLVGLFWLDALLQGRPAAQSRRLLLLLCAVAAAALASPFGLHGALAPLEIFHNYAYKIMENQSILTLIRTSRARPNVPWFLLVFALAAASFVFAFLREGRRPAPVVLLLAAAFSAAGWAALRNLTLFGFFLLPVLAINLREAFGERGERSIKGKWVLAGSISIVLLFLALQRDVVGAQAREFGAGLLPGNLRSIEYFRENRLHGPVMNNYDIGGYLIFALPETERVYVDNRPEAYPGSFLTDTYIRMQTDEAVWSKEDERWHFNVICFYYHEDSRRSVRFLESRLHDPEWAPVYVDPRVLILLRRTPENEALIRRDEIPRSRFVVRAQPARNLSQTWRRLGPSNSAK